MCLKTQTQMLARVNYEYNMQQDFISPAIGN